MFKTISTLVLTLTLAFTLFAQPSDKLGYESGFVLNRFFHNQNIKARNADPVNFFLKFEYTGLTKTHDRWCAYVPMGLQYSYYNVDYTRQPGSGDSLLNAGGAFHHFVLYAGPQLEYHSDHNLAGAALLLNNQYVSARVFALHALNKKWWIGPSFELFFCDVLNAAKELNRRKQVPGYQNQRLLGLNGKALRLNAGIKLQMDLNY